MATYRQHAASRHNLRPRHTPPTLAQQARNAEAHAKLPQLTPTPGQSASPLLVNRPKQEEA